MTGRAPESPSEEQLAAFFLAAQHPTTSAWVDPERRLSLLAEQRKTDVLLARDLEIAAQRAQHFAPGHAPETFLNRWAPVTNDLHAMLSIRYEGLDVTKPFVDAMVTSRPLSQADLAPMVTAARDAYGSLRPGYVRVWSREPAGHFAGTDADKRFVAAPLADLRSSTEPPPELTLSVTDDLAHYDDAVAAYRAVDADHPGHRVQAALQSAESLEDCLDEGELFDVLIDDSWAGYVGVAAEGETLGLPAYVVQEVILAEQFRGHGYGRYLSTAVARALPEDGKADILLGTIHQDNCGALGAALVGGRVDVGGWLQLPIR
jgi:GNAT superfamily N-acetyltransferase